MDENLDEINDRNLEESSNQTENKIHSAHQKLRNFCSIFRSKSCNESDDCQDSYSVIERKSSTGFSYKLQNEKSTFKTLWPVNCREFIFLPVFPVLKNEIEDQFKIIKFIAKGSFGSVYQVKRNKDSQIFALKVFEKSKILLDNYVEQLKTEASIHKTISHHPFVVTSFNHWQNKGFVYHLTEFLSEGEFLQKIRKFSEKLARFYVAELALVLDFLHNAGIIFRDLKSENILLDHNFHIKLTDFGLSKWLKLGNKTFTICGTRSSMAPEIFTGEGYSHAVDWFALGILIYRMMTINNNNTTTTFHDDDDQVYRNTNQFNDFDDNNVNIANSNKVDDDDNGDKEMEIEIENLEVSSATRDLILRLLEKNPQHRLKSLLALKRIAFFHNFNFDDVRHMKISPRKLIEEDSQLCLK